MAKKMSSKNVKTLVIVLSVLVCFGIISIVTFIGIFINNITGESSNESSSNVDSNVTNVTAENTSVEYEYPVFDENKIIKSSDSIETEVLYNIKEYDSRGLFSATIVDDKVYISKENINNNFDSIYANASLNVGELYEVKNITEKVIDVHLGYVGADYNKLILTILTENGDVKYVDLSTTLNFDGNFEASDVIANKIVRIENVELKENNEIKKSIILISNDESTYNIEDLI